MANHDDQAARLRAFDLTNVAGPESDQRDDDDGASEAGDGQDSDEPAGSPR